MAVVVVAASQPAAVGVAIILLPCDDFPQSSNTRLFWLLFLLLFLLANFSMSVGLSLLYAMNQSTGKFALLWVRGDGRRYRRARAGSVRTFEHSVRTGTVDMQAGPALAAGILTVMPVREKAPA
jgi:hypothetical protein